MGNFSFEHEVFGQFLIYFFEFITIRNYSPLLTFNAQSHTGGCFLEEKLKPQKKTATSLAVFQG
jgi:hypothetical protein